MYAIEDANNPCDLLRQMFREAVDAVDPLRVVPPHLPPPPKGRPLVFGAGKTSARMALALERHWRGSLEGLVVTRYGHAEACSQIEIIEAGYPTPDDAGATAARRMLAMTQGLIENDLVIFLISGGGSTLLSLPAEGVDLQEKRRINGALFKSGATIGEMNCVRKHLSAVKGGHLALACRPAKVVTLIISDVPGGDPAVVASSPSIAERSTGADALTILARYGIGISDAPGALLPDPARAAPSVDDPRLQGNQVTVVTTAQLALEAAAGMAREHGYTPLVLGDSIEGESREIAIMHAGIARQVLLRDQPLPKPCIILSGGETTVTVRGNGRGGRNAEFLLSLCIALDGLEGVHLKLTPVETPAFRPERREYPGLKAGVSRKRLGRGFKPLPSPVYIDRPEGLSHFNCWDRLRHRRHRRHRGQCRRRAAPVLPAARAGHGSGRQGLPGQ